MSSVLKLLLLVGLGALYLPAQSATPDAKAKPVVLQKNEGELRTRKPRRGCLFGQHRFLAEDRSEDQRFQTFAGLYRGDRSRCSDPETQTSWRRKRYF